MKYIILGLFLLVSLNAKTQNNNNLFLKNALKKFNFIEGKVIQESDTITYYLKNYIKKPTKLVVYIQGTDANPIFSYKIKDGKPVFYRWFVDDYQKVDSTYTFAIIPKPGMEGIFHEDSIAIPQKYYENNYQGYRVNQIHQSIEHIIQNHLKRPEQVIVYGHSEGATIGAALALKNKNITNLGFWSGNVLNNFYEFSLFNRIEALKGQISDSLAHENIMGILNWYKGVIENPNSTELDHFGFTNKRWSTYEKPPIEDLLAIDIPIFAMFGTKDESTPIETAYLLPVQFMQKRKTNLTFEVCMNCNHSYIEKNGENIIHHWDEIFVKFMEWTKKE